MKNLLVILLAMFVGMSVVGCKHNLCVCENTGTVEINKDTEEGEVYRSSGIYGPGVWVIEVDLKKDKLSEAITYINRYFSFYEYSKEGSLYTKK